MYEEKFLKNAASMRLGAPRLRMLRTHEGEQCISLLLFVFSSYLTYVT